VALAAALWVYHTPMDMRLDAGVVSIASEAGGTITRVYIKEGAEVSQGEPLIQLDTRQVQATRRFLQNAIHLEEQATFPDRIKLRNLYSRLSQTSLDLAQLTITSPARGRIASLAPLRVGAVLKAQTTVATLRPTFN
jgi:multidrug resistance efflux pump